MIEYVDVDGDSVNVNAIGNSVPRIGEICVMRGFHPEDEPEWFTVQNVIHMHIDRIHRKSYITHVVVLVPYEGEKLIKNFPSRWSELDEPDEHSEGPRESTCFGSKN